MPAPSIALLVRDDPGTSAPLIAQRLGGLVARALDAGVEELLLELREQDEWHGPLDAVPLDPFVALGALEAPAALRLGCLAPIGGALAPSLFAKYLSTLALCREGEVALVLRSGASPSAGALAEAYAIVAAMLDEPAPSFEGRSFHIEGAWNEPRAPSRPRLGLCYEGAPELPLPEGLDDLLVRPPWRHLAPAGRHRLLLEAGEGPAERPLAGATGVVLALPAGVAAEEAGRALEALRRALGS